MKAAPLTYPEVGATRQELLPAGYHHLRTARHIGYGRQRFEEAATTLLTWGVHRRSGIGVRHRGERIAEGAEAVLLLGRGPFGVRAPVRVVYVVDEPRRRGLAYGSLPGHPECGEESFVVELGDDDAVTFAITAFSRPASRLARAAGPVGRGVQRWVTRRYLRAL